MFSEGPGRVEPAVVAAEDQEKAGQDRHLHFDMERSEPLPRGLLRRSGSTAPPGFVHRSMVLGVHDNVPPQAFSFALGAQVSVVSQGQVYDSTLA